MGGNRFDQTPTIEAVTITIASSGNLSGALDCGGGALVAVLLPGTWTSAGITFEVSNDNSTFGDLYWNDAEYSPLSSASGGEAISLEPAAMYGWQFVKVRSGTTGTPVAQAAERTITCLVQPL